MQVRNCPFLALTNNWTVSVQATALVEKQQQHLVDMHKEGCPWRVRQCDRAFLL